MRRGWDNDNGVSRRICVSSPQVFYSSFLFFYLQLFKIDYAICTEWGTTRVTKVQFRTDPKNWELPNWTENSVQFSSQFGFWPSVQFISSGCSKILRTGSNCELNWTDPHVHWYFFTCYEVFINLNPHKKLLIMFRQWHVCSLGCPNSWVLGCLIDTIQLSVRN